MKNWFFILLMITSLSTGAFAAEEAAAKLDLITQSALIEKLEGLLKISTDDTESKENLILRLADLHSERARLLAMDNEGRGEEDHRKDIESDRKRALELYQTGFAKADDQKQGAILLQTAHLNQMLGNQKQSRNLFDKIVKDKKSYAPELTAQAYIELGDDEMTNQHFTRAKKDFKKALAIKNSPRKGYIQYRIAWCNYHDGKTKEAISGLIDLLNNRDLFKKADGSVDSSFQEEASRDLATFMSHRDVSASDIQTLITVTPENVRQNNLTYLATELDRSGHKKSALQVWAIIGTQKENADSKLEGQIKITKIQYDLGKKQQTVIELQKSAQMLKDADCKDLSKQSGGSDQCESLRQQIRKIVTDWGKAEEREPSAELISAYKVYATYFPDIEINYWAALAAEKKKQYVDAFQFYKNSAELTLELKSHPENNKSGININNIFEGSLLGAIECAELAKDANLREQAYNQYLQLNPNGQKTLEVQYQIAQVTLDKGDSDGAAQKFYAVALSQQKGNADIKNKAADLALDTLVLLKDDERLEKWSTEFAEHFPKRKPEFLAIYRKTVLNHAAQVINDSKSQAELEKEFDKLSHTNLSRATPQERINFHKHQSLIATKLKNLDAIIISSNALLKEKSLSEQDRREALANLSWAQEMKFDFAGAFATQKRIKPTKGQEDEHVLKLGVLAELAHKNAIPYYEKYISIGSDRIKKQQVAFSLVRLAKNKIAAFKKYKSVLAGNTQLYISAGLYAYDESRSESLLRDLLSQKHALSTFEGQLLNRSIQIKEVDLEATKLAHSHLKTANANALRSSVKDRLALINRFEKTANQAIAKQDWTLQFMSLATLGREYERLANDISRLPIPRQLKKSQRTQYKQLVQQQIAPYRSKSKDIYSKLEELWDKKDNSSFADVMDLATQTRTPGTKLAQREVHRIILVAHYLRFSTTEMTKKWQQRQKLSQELLSLRESAQKNPFDSSYLEKMKAIENQLGRGPMVAYLDARLLSIKGAGGNSLKTGGIN